MACRRHCCCKDPGRRCTQGRTAVPYDAEGRLRQTAIGTTTTNLLYDATNLIAEYDAAGTTLQRRYVHGPGTDEPIVWYEGSGTTASGGSGASFYRGAKPEAAPSLVPRPNDFKVDPKTGFVKDTHGVSVFDNPASVSSKGFVPHRIDQNSIPNSLRIIQRGSDPRHFEIVPKPDANLTPQQFMNACGSIACAR